MARQFALVLIVMNVLVFATLSMAQRRPTNRPTYTAREEQLEQLPEYTNPAIRNKLKCSACKCLTKELYAQLHPLYEKRHGHPKLGEVAEILDGFCRTVRNEYGLLMKNNLPTTDFSRNSAITRLQGAWINNFIEGECGELLSEHEERILDEFPNFRSASDVQTKVCSDWYSICSEGEVRRDEL